MLIIYFITRVKPISSQEITIGVAQFENRSDKPEDRFIAITLTDDIINRMIVIDQFKVVPDLKSIKSDTNVLIAGIADIATGLKVSYLLTGSIQREAEELVIRAQLYESMNKRIRWSDVYRRKSDELLELQSTIVQQVADELNIQLSPEDRKTLHEKSTDSEAAYEYYMRGRALYIRYKQEYNDSAVKMFKRAINKDSTFAKAWAGLGDAYSQIYRFKHEESWNDSCILAASRAIELNPNLSSGYKALANAYNYKRYYDKALPLLQKAVQLDPDNAAAIGNLGSNYLFMGNLPEALRLEKKSATMNQQNFVPYQVTGMIYALLGDYEKSEEWLSESLQLDSTYAHTYEVMGIGLVARGRKQKAMELIPKLLKHGGNRFNTFEKAGIIAHYAGDLKAARSFYQMAIDANPNYMDDPNLISPIGLGKLLLASNKKVKAEVYLLRALELNEREIERGSQDDDPRFRIAAIHAVYGNKAKMLEWIRKAIDAHWMDYAQFMYGPWFEPYRTDREFLDAIEPVRIKMDSMRIIAARY